MENEFSKQEAFEELNAKKNKLELDLIEQGKDKTTKIQDIKRLGTVQLLGEEKECTLYLVEELDINTDNIILKYYADNTLIGIEKDGQAAINGVLKVNIDEAKAIAQRIEELKQNSEVMNEKEKEENGIFSLNELLNEKEEEYSEILGINKDDIKAISEIEGEDKEKKQDTKEDEELDTTKVESLNNLQEIKANTKVNNYENMENVLGMEGVKKFVIVYSEDAAKISENGNRNNSRYSMIAVMNDGTSISMDNKLDPNMSAGTNSGKGRIQTDADGITREEYGNASMYKIKGTDKNLSFEMGEYGEIQAYYGEMTKGTNGNEGNVFNGTQIETSNIKRTSRKVRAQEDPNRGEYNADNKTQEATRHIEHGDDEISIENSDGNEMTREECENVYEKQIPGVSFKITWRNLSDITKIPLEEIIQKYDEKIKEGLSPDKVVLNLQEEALDTDDDNDKKPEKGKVDRELGDYRKDKRWEE